MQHHKKVTKATSGQEPPVNDRHASIKKVLQAFTLSELPKAKVTYKSPRGKVYVQPGEITENIFRTVMEPEAFVQQQLYVLFVGANGDLLCWRLISSGDVDAVLVNTKLILTIAIQVQAAEIVVGHTRPHFSKAAQYSQVESFIKQFQLVSTIMGISFCRYYLIGEVGFVDAFVDFTPSQAYTAGARVVS